MNYRVKLKSESFYFDCGIIGFWILSISISPFLSIPFLLISLTRRRYYPIFFLSIFLALIAYQINPDESVDLSRWFLIFDNISQSGAIGLQSYIESKPDKIAYIYIYMLSVFNLTKEWISFSTILLSYLVYLSLFYKENRLNRWSKIVYYSLLLLYISHIDYRVVLFGVRQGLAVIISVFAVYIWFFDRKKILAIVLLLISINVHFMTLIVPIILVSVEVLKKIGISSYIKVILLSAILIYILPIDLVLKNHILTISEFGNSSQKQIVDAYADGYWSQGYVEDLSFNGFVQSIISLMSVLFLFLLNWLRSNKAEKLDIFIALYFLFLSLISFSDTLFLRYATIGTMILPIYISRYYFQKTIVVKVSIVLSTILLFSYLFAMREELINVMENNMLSPTYIILNKEVNSIKY